MSGRKVKLDLASPARSRIFRGWSYQFLMENKAYRGGFKPMHRLASASSKPAIDEDQPYPMDVEAFQTISLRLVRGTCNE